MKKLLLTCCLFAASFASAQELDSAYRDLDPQIAVALQSYERCLTHTNLGVVESAVFNVLKYQARHPEVDMSRLHSQLLVLANDCSDGDIRRKARVVARIMIDRDLLAAINPGQFEDADQFFDVMMLGAQLNAEELLSTTAVPAQ